MNVYAVRREADRQLQAAASQYNRQRHALFSSELAMQVGVYVCLHFLSLHHISSCHEPCFENDSSVTACALQSCLFSAEAGCLRKRASVCFANLHHALFMKLPPPVCVHVLIVKSSHPVACLHVLIAKSSHPVACLRVIAQRGLPTHLPVCMC